jgi:hypothetical protein
MGKFFYNEGLKNSAGRLLMKASEQKTFFNAAIGTLPSISSRISQEVRASFKFQCAKV